MREGNEGIEASSEIVAPAFDGVNRPASGLDRGAAVDPAVHEATLSRLAVLESRLARAEEENRAFVASMRRAADVVDEMMRQATSDAEALRAAARRELADNRAQIEQHRAAYLDQVQREAARILAEARAAAHELVIVARADARAAVQDERHRIAGELEMLAAVRERITEERRALAHFHSQLSGRLRQLVHSMVEFSEDPAVPSGSAFASAVLTGPQRPGTLAPTTPATARPLPGRDRDREAAPIGRDDQRSSGGDEPGSGPPRAEETSPLHADDEHLDRAFDEFFSSDVEHEPSRAWIFEE